MLITHFRSFYKEESFADNFAKLQQYLLPGSPSATTQKPDTLLEWE